MARNEWRPLDSVITVCANQTGGKVISEGDAPTIALFTPEAIADVREIARLRASDFNAQAAAAIMQLTAYLRGDPPTSQGVDAIDTFIDSYQDSQDTTTAVTVAEVSGIVELVLRHDLRWAERDFRRAVSLDKSKESSWDFLSGILATQNRWGDLRDLCRERIIQTDTAAARTLLFAAFTGLKKYDAALEQGRIAVKMSPGDLNTHWRLGIALLGTDSTITEANRELDIAWKLSDYASSKERGDLEIAKVIGAALAGDRHGTLRSLEQAEQLGMNLNAKTVKDLRDIIGDSK
jgi:hypothetical protein